MMQLSYKIFNATNEEQKIIKCIIQYIYENYSEKLEISKLESVEVVDELEGGASARTINNKIMLARKNSLHGVDLKKDKIESVPADKNLKILISTIYHELWHVSTWEKYKLMYEYDKVGFANYAYVFWIEYIAHIETVFMEDIDIMKEFCERFVGEKWDKIEYGYSQFIMALPYYLVRSNYLELFDELTEKIEFDELKAVVYDFNKTTKQLQNNNSMQEIDKANIIRDMIEKLFE